MVFLIEFLEKVDFEKKLVDNKKSMKITSGELDLASNVISLKSAFTATVFEMFSGFC